MFHFIAEWRETAFYRVGCPIPPLSGLICCLCIILLVLGTGLSRLSESRRYGTNLQRLVDFYTVNSLQFEVHDMRVCRVLPATLCHLITNCNKERNKGSLPV